MNHQTETLPPEAVTVPNEDEMRTILLDAIKNREQITITVRRPGVTVHGITNKGNTAFETVEQIDYTLPPSALLRLITPLNTIPQLDPYTATVKSVHQEGIW